MGQPDWWAHPDSSELVMKGSNSYIKMGDHNIFEIPTIEVYNIQTL
jgi:hypothetical protein